MKRESSTPTSAAAATPSQSEPVVSVVRKPVIAPISMIPSIPRLSTPARSQRISPSVPKMMGVAMRIMAARSPVIKAVVITCSISLSPPLRGIRSAAGR